MEIIEATVVQGVDRFYTDTLNSCYEEFLRIKPNIDVLGDLFFDMLKDAVRSLIMNLAKKYDNAAILNNNEKITKLSEKYARIYFKTGKQDTVLIMLRGALCDIIREYDIDNRKYDALISNLYIAIRNLITV